MSVAHVATLADDGDWNAADHRIQVRLREDYVTVFHEAIHAISDLYGLNLSERRVRCLETALGAFLVDNPGFVRGLLESKGRGA